MAAPFVRSAGGKTELAPVILDLLPKKLAFDTYIEPFIGGGGMFFHLEKLGRLDGKTVILGDADADLVALYAAVRDNVLQLEAATRKLIHGAYNSGSPMAYYNDQRALWNAGERTPARHLFLRKGCWNGLWRTNRKGEMNTPWRGKPPQRLEMELMYAMSALHRADRAETKAAGPIELLDWDFRRYEEDLFIGPGTLVYLDPPYLGDKGAFVGYTKHAWRETDAVELLRLCAVWAERGATVVLSNADTPRTRALTKAHWPAATIHRIYAKRSINSDGAKRGKVPELVVIE